MWTNKPLKGGYYWFNGRLFENNFDEFDVIHITYRNDDEIVGSLNGSLYYISEMSGEWWYIDPPTDDGVVSAPVNLKDITNLSIDDSGNIVVNAEAPLDSLIRRAKDLLRKNRKIEAIKLIRQETNLGLYEANKFCEQLIARMNSDKTPDDTIN